MRKAYFIRGTISVQAEGGKSIIWISPCAGFLTPDRQKLIAFPAPSSKGKTKGKAKLMESANDKQFKFKDKAKVIQNNIPALLVVATQQKPIELRLKKFTKRAKIRITGFVFPAPLDHAQGR